ncbi:unnamed protein product [Ostreobium quekettii]|uniref:SDR family NAD(P)-dependent oxidoreductase n=1 Tax=Ostreobium quekettii TaxID=121088 RepID=A0A8S1IQA8_9CHLO|nr:unnamed protein product [Ostreobium quekettii]
MTSEGDLRLQRLSHPPVGHFEGKGVWVTGASQGLGEALAKYFAAQGARLVISARREGELERVKASCVGKWAPQDITVLPFDLTSSHEVLRSAVETAWEALGGIDYVINNAGEHIQMRPRTAASNTT